MSITSKILLILTSITALSVGNVSAHDANYKNPENRLKLVMHGLLKDTQSLSEGIFYDDFKKIELSAKNIANHPNPGMPTMKKVMGYLGKEMPTFKDFDTRVHKTAVAIEKSASEKDMPSIIMNYHTLIDGCQSCHSQFKVRVSKILNSK